MKSPDLLYSNLLQNSGGNFLVSSSVALAERVNVVNVVNLFGNAKLHDFPIDVRYVSTGRVLAKIRPS